MRRFVEEMFDMLLFLGVILGGLLLFIGYWRGEYQTRCAEIVLEEFLEKVSEKGYLSPEDYEAVVLQLNRINEAFELRMHYVGNEMVPCYAPIPKEKLDWYYLERNRRQQVQMECLLPEIEEEKAEELRLQTETNASILAAENLNSLPLSNEEVEIFVEAVRKNQTVYEGENLITLCRVNSTEGTYFVEAEPICAEQSGFVELRVYIGDKCLKTEVNVICYPRMQVCEYGHEFVNSKEYVQVSEKSETWEYCPYCKILPKEMRCTEELLIRSTGNDFGYGELWLEVTYFDGHKEWVAPDSLEWQDNYDENFCGLQLVTIQYRGMQEYVTVLAENDVCKNCQGSCKDRYYPDYALFPYCTECMSKEELFTGRVENEVIVRTTGEIVAALDKKGVFLLPGGDFLIAELVDKEKLVTILQKKSKRNRKEKGER